MAIGWNNLQRIFYFDNLMPPLLNELDLGVNMGFLHYWDASSMMVLRERNIVNSDTTGEVWKKRLAACQMSPKLSIMFQISCIGCTILIYSSHRQFRYYKIPNAPTTLKYAIWPKTPHKPNLTPPQNDKSSMIMIILSFPFISTACSRTFPRHHDNFLPSSLWCFNPYHIRI